MKKRVPVIKYARVEERRLIIVPKGEQGLKTLQERNNPRLVKTIETIAGKDIAAYMVEFGSDVRFFKVEDNLAENRYYIRVYTLGLELFEITFPSFIFEDAQ